MSSIFDGIKIDKTKKYNPNFVNLSESAKEEYFKETIKTEDEVLKILGLKKSDLKKRM